MSSYFLKIFYALLLLLFHVSAFNAEAKCIEKERQALLYFKQGILDFYAMLSTWKDDEDNADCCKWKGVQCNNATGHIHTLDLRGQEDTHYLQGQINFTSLIHLQNIEYLDLSYNQFAGSRIPEFINSFTKLRYLNLSYSHVGGRIPYQLGNLSKLEYLNFEMNRLVGPIPSQLGKLTHLRFLDLSYNIDIDGEIPCQLGNLSKLEYLNFEMNGLVGPIPSRLGNLSKLQHLNLGGNSLSGTFPFQNGNLPYLRDLIVSGNFDVKTDGAEWLSTLYSLRTLELTSFHNLGSSLHWLQTISKLIPNLQNLRLFNCSLLDNDILSLFHSHSNFTTSLTILDLSSNMLTSSAFQFLSNFSLNLQELYLSDNNIVFSSPLYPNFPSLVILDLSYNNFTSLIFQGNFNINSKLRELYLRNCSHTDRSFPVTFTSTLNFSSSLVYVDLSSNLFKSSAIFNWLFNFTINLQTIYLWDNLLEGSIPDGFEKVTKSLQVVDLSNNKLQGDIPTFFGNICTLQELYLSSNNLSGDLSSFIQNSSLCNRHTLYALGLSNNRITGKLLESIGLLSELEYLYLGDNSLEGDVTESHLWNLSKLKELYLSRNSFSLKFPSTWVPPFQLTYIGLATCKLGPSFPSWLQTQMFLWFIDISDNGLKDYVPEWLWNNLQYVGFLNMSHNNLVGAIANSPFKLYYSPSLILDSNQFEGGVPSFLLQASMLLLSENKFSDLFSFVCGKNTTTNLAVLDLSDNQITGQLPDCWKSVNTLLFLGLRNNNVSGKIPQSMGTLVELEALVLANNSLMGELPSTLKNCKNLKHFDVDDNLLSGPIPLWIGESMQQLLILSMKGNRFSGNIPMHLCYLRHIQLLDLSRNNLSKGIPTCINSFIAMSEKSTSSSDIGSYRFCYNHTCIPTYEFVADFALGIMLMWKDVERGFKNPEWNLKIIDLSSNNLTGVIPKEIGYLLGLVSLNLSRNNLSGKIPSEIGNLNLLEFLDLSRNHFSGKIPSTLSQIYGIGRLDLSYNSLCGRIPFGRQLQTFDSSSFEGNPELCGKEINKICPDDVGIIMSKGTTVEDEDDDSVFYESLYMSLGIGYFVGFWGLIGPILLWRSWRNAYLRFLNRLTNYAYM